MTESPRRLGGASNYWLYHPSTGYDLTRSRSPGLTLRTTTSQPVTVCPSTTALIVIDMQNLFLDPAAGRPLNPLARTAEKTLRDVGIPACREAGIQVVHLTWGISEEELQNLPPALMRAFGAVLEGVLEDVDGGGGGGGGEVRETFGERPTVGEEIGNVTLKDGRTVPGGKLLMRDQWNTALHSPLEASFVASQSLRLPDVRFHKAHISGFSSLSCSPSSSSSQKLPPVVSYLRERGITTLLFAGVNTDQCVLGSLQDAACLGFDALLLRDGCATASPAYARRMVEFNCRKSWGFVTSCEALGEAVQRMRDRGGNKG